MKKFIVLTSVLMLLSVQSGVAVDRSSQIERKAAEAKKMLAEFMKEENRECWPSVWIGNQVGNQEGYRAGYQDGYEDGIKDKGKGHNDSGDEDGGGGA